MDYKSSFTSCGSDVAIQTMRVMPVTYATSGLISKNIRLFIFFVLQFSQNFQQSKYGFKEPKLHLSKDSPRSFTEVYFV